MSQKLELRAVDWGYGWLVIREDRRLVKSGSSLKECLRWIETWGDTIGQTQSGFSIHPEQPTPWDEPGGEGSP